MDVPWKVILAFVGVFIAGAVFGGVFTLGVSRRERETNRAAERVAAKALNPRPAAGQTPPASTTATPPRPTNPITPQLMNQFTRRIPNLSSEQKDTLRVILGRAGEDFHRLRQQNIADVARVTERMYADVAALLTLEQRTDLEAMRRKYEEGMQAARKKAVEAAEKDAPPRPAPGAAATPVRPSGTP